MNHGVYIYIYNTYIICNVYCQNPAYNIHAHTLEEHVPGFRQCVFFVEEILTRATSRRGPCESRQIRHRHLSPAQLFNSKCISRKCLTLKMFVNVTEYNIRNGSIRWQVSIYIKVDRERLSLALTVFEILKIHDLENVDRGHDV